MKRIVATLGVIAAMAILPSVAGAANSAQVKSKRMWNPITQRTERITRASFDDRSGQTVYWFGNHAAQ